MGEMSSLQIGTKSLLNSRQYGIKYLLKRSAALSGLTEAEVVNKVDKAIQNGGIRLVYPHIRNYDFKIGLEIFCAILENDLDKKRNNIPFVHQFEGNFVERRLTV